MGGREEFSLLLKEYDKNYDYPPLFLKAFDSVKESGDRYLNLPTMRKKVIREGLNCFISHVKKQRELLGNDEMVCNLLFAEQKASLEKWKILILSFFER